VVACDIDSFPQGCAALADNLLSFLGLETGDAHVPIDFAQ
jgi:hypothetical protein